MPRLTVQSTVLLVALLVGILSVEAVVSPPCSSAACPCSLYTRLH